MKPNDQLKILHINTYDISGGAARSAFRLHKGLQAAGQNSFMLVQDKKSDDCSVFGPKTKLAKGFRLIKPTLDKIPLYIYPKRKLTPFHVQWQPDSVLNNIRNINPDIIHLHWICAGFIDIATLGKIQKPIVWTLHDMWPFTGGCHYSGSCSRYEKLCGMCPELDSKKAKDISTKIFNRKYHAWKNQEFHIVTPSKWLAKSAKNSALFERQNIRVIPYGLRLDQYKPIDRVVARNILGLDKNKKYILFGALNAQSEKRKGYDFLESILKKLKGHNPLLDLELIIVGSCNPHNGPDFEFPTRYMGTLADDISLTILYSAVDGFIFPSTEDNLPNMVMEAMACGAPSVGFKIGGVPDMIDHKINGYLAQPFNTDDFAYGISWVLEDRHRYASLSLAARNKVTKEFDIQLSASRYVKLYNDLIP